jgi:hypothetical protein
MRATARGEDPPPSTAGVLDAALSAAAWSDETALRMFAEINGCLTLPSDVFGREGAIDHVLDVARWSRGDRVPGPDRAELLELVA